MDNLGPILIALIAGPLGAGITAYLQKRRERADITKTITDAAGGIIEQLRKRVDRLGSQVDDLEKKSAKQEQEINNLRRGVNLLIGQIKAAGLVPVWHPGQPVPDEA